jgi:hypothetical protein
MISVKISESARVGNKMPMLKRTMLKRLKILTATKQKRNHNGCGAEMPKVSRDGIKISVEFKKEQESGEQKKVLSAEEVLLPSDFLD